MLERLLLEPARRMPQQRFVVAGPLYPDTLVWPANVERLDHVPPAGHPAFYAASRFTLNVTRADMVAVGYSPSIRLFEAAACGAPILSDRWAGIETLFTPGEDFLMARSGAEMERHLAALRDDADLRAALVARGLATVRARHTCAHRVDELMGVLDRIRAPSPIASPVAR